MPANFKGVVNINRIKEIIKHSYEQFLYSHWRLAISAVLSQWITITVLAAIGIWIIVTLFSIPIATVTDLVPNEVLNFVSTNKKAVIWVVFIFFCVNVYKRHKWYKTLHSISEVQFSENLTTKGKLYRCNLGIENCESHKEVLLLKKDLIKYCSPIPIITAVLGFVLETTGIKSLNWQFIVIACISMIVIYVFLCLNNLRLFRDNQIIIDKWNQVKYNIMRNQDSYE